MNTSPLPYTSQQEAIVVEDAEVVVIVDANSDVVGENDREDSNIVSISTGTISAHAEQDLDDTLPMSPQGMPMERNNVLLIIHRGQVLRQLIGHFCNDPIMNADIQIQLVLPDGTHEKGLDTGGLVRDCLSEFRGEFLEQCTTENEFEVPFLRHDFGQVEWESVGCILAFGWERERYLPVKIAPAIIEQAAFGFTRSSTGFTCLPLIGH